MLCIIYSITLYYCFFFLGWMCPCRHIKVKPSHFFFSPLAYYLRGIASSVLRQHKKVTMERLDANEGKDTQLWLSAWRLGTRQLHQKCNLKCAGPWTLSAQSHKNSPTKTVPAPAMTAPSAPSLTIRPPPPPHFFFFFQTVLLCKIQTVIKASKCLLSLHLPPA